MGRRSKIRCAKRHTQIISAPSPNVVGERGNPVWWVIKQALREAFCQLGKFAWENLQEFDWSSFLG